MKRVAQIFILQIFILLISLTCTGFMGAAPAAFAGDILDQTNGEVCVAIPIFPNLKTDATCPSGIIPSNTPGGPIIFYLTEVLKLMNLLVGGIIVLVLVLAGVQYIASMGDPANIKAAKKRISNAIVALVLYMMMFAILNFLVPGGIL